jgi:DNA/RNA-binding domain of Phe-tRNA-synthetase-like protein
MVGWPGRARKGARVARRATRYTRSAASAGASRMVTVDPHPLAELAAFVTTLPRPLGALPSPAGLVAQLSLGAPAPLTSSDEVRAAVRELLRHGGYKPTGRGKPASEYLLRAVGEGALASINAAVDACNVASLHSGLPISVVDLALARPPFRVGLGAAGASYVFNAGGQTIDVTGLLCLFDADGPCANAVKDSQRTKTTPGTTRTLSVVWGTTARPGRAAAAARWYRELLHGLGATTEDA